MRDEYRELLRLMADGLPDATIARRLSIGERTLARRIADLYEALNVSTRFQAGVAAERFGLLESTARPTVEPEMVHRPSSRRVAALADWPRPTVRPIEHSRR